MTSKSKKSGSNSKPRLKRTLSREIGVRDSTASDAKYLWAAYKMGLMEKVSPIFVDGLSKSEFNDTLVEHLSTYQKIWTIEAIPPGRQKMPIGYMALWQMREDHIVFFIGEMIWFPWASRRNILEGAIHTFNQVRNDIKVIEFAAPGDVKFFTHLCKYGIMRRAGTSKTFFTTNEDGAIFETLPFKRD